MVMVMDFIIIVENVRQNAKLTKKTRAEWYVLMPLILYEGDKNVKNTFLLQGNILVLIQIVVINYIVYVESVSRLLIEKGRNS